MFLDLLAFNLSKENMPLWGIFVFCLTFLYDLFITLCPPVIHSPLCKHVIIIDSNANRHLRMMIFSLCEWFHNDYIMITEHIVKVFVYLCLL